MGRQFSFFLGPNDQERFEGALRASGDIVFLKHWSPGPKPEEVQSSLVLEMGKEVLNILVAHRADLPLIRFQPMKGRTEFFCDPTFAPVVEFSRCYVTERIIRVGRFYRTDAYWSDNGERQKKSSEFIAWADRLYQLGKRSLSLVEGTYYAGSEALRLRDQGVRFEGLDTKVGFLAD